MLGIYQGIAVGNVELFVINIVQKHIDAAQVVGGNIYLLTKETLSYIFLAQHFSEFQQ